MELLETVFGSELGASVDDARVYSEMLDALLAIEPDSPRCCAQDPSGDGGSVLPSGDRVSGRSIVDPDDENPLPGVPPRPPGIPV